MEMNKAVSTEISFTHVVVEGTPYTVGRLQGEFLKDDPERVKYLTPTLPFLARYSEREAQRALEYLDKYCPGIGEEIQGAADAFGVPVQEIAFLGGKSREDGSSPIPVDGPMSGSRQALGGSHCSQFAVLPFATEDGHLYVGQNTDCGLDDLDLRLCTTRVQGKAAHIGFSDMIFGRTGGVNEHGFCVTTSWGAPGVWLEGEGLPYFAVARALMERCQCVDEALDVLADMPIAWCTNFIVADRRGEAALVEVAYAHRGVKRIRQGASDGRDAFLCATNHYTLPSMMAYDSARMRQSVARCKTIVSRMNSAVPGVTKDEMRAVLSEPMPEGVCLHHYSSGLGTLWSTIYDVTDARVEVCFGAPSSARNSWHAFGLGGRAGVTEYRAHLPDEPTYPGFWERLPPGADD
jgi:predicted choloylglycine hydrolase